MSIVAVVASPFEASLANAPTGLVGVVGVRVLDGEGATTVARTTTGIVEFPAGSGLYSVTLTAPSVPGQYSVFWDSGTVTPQTTATEALTVVAGATTGLTYASPTLVRQLAADLDVADAVPVDDTAVLRVIDRASRDLDRVTGRRNVVLALLTDDQAGALLAATAWQTVFLLSQGPESELGSDDLLTGLPAGLSFAPPSRAPRVAPRVAELVAGTGLILRSGTAPPPLDELVTT